jgi:hypothetical protein
MEGLRLQVFSNAWAGRGKRQESYEHLMVKLEKRRVQAVPFGLNVEIHILLISYEEMSVKL